MSDQIHTSKNEFEVQIRIHCPYCPKSFYSVKGLKVHLRRYCKNKPKPETKQVNFKMEDVNA